MLVTGSTVALAAPPNGHPVLPSALDAVTFMSPSAVCGMTSMLLGDLQPLAGAAVICIGPTTAAAAEDAGIAAVARDHTSEGIIAQETRPVTHAHSPEHLVAMGQEVECSVLARAVTCSIEHRILRNGGRTVVFA